MTVQNANKNYGAPLPAFTGTITGLVNGDTLGTKIAVSYSSTATASSAVTTYAITATVGGTAIGNYTLTNTAGTLTINPVALTVAVQNANKTYGAALPTFTSNVTGLVNGDTGGAAITVSYSTTATSGSPVTTYPITESVIGTVAGNYTIAKTPGTLTVTLAALTVVVQANSKTYSAALPTLTGNVGGLIMATRWAPPSR